MHMSSRSWWLTHIQTSATYMQALQNDCHSPSLPRLGSPIFDFKYSYNPRLRRRIKYRMGFSKYVHMLLIELREYLSILTVSCSITLRRDSHVFQKTKKSSNSRAGEK